MTHFYFSLSKMYNIAKYNKLNSTRIINQTHLMSLAQVVFYAVYNILIILQMNLFMRNFY